MNRLTPELHLLILKEAATLPQSSFAPCLALASTCQSIYGVYKDNLTSLLQAHLGHHAPSSQGFMLLRIASVLPSPRDLFGVHEESPRSVRALQETKTSLQQILKESGAAISTLSAASLQTLVRTLTMFRAASIALHRHCLQYEWAELYEDDEEVEFTQDCTNKMAQLSEEIWDSRIDPKAENPLTEQLLELVYFHRAVGSSQLDLSGVEERLGSYFRCKDKLSGLLSAFCEIFGNSAPLQEEFRAEIARSGGRVERIAMGVRGRTDIETLWRLACAKDQKGKVEAGKNLIPREGVDYSRERPPGEKAPVFKSAYPELDGLSLEDAPSIVYTPGAPRGKKATGKK